jgi:di/tricarboxylate transporter
MHILQALVSSVGGAPLWAVIVVAIGLGVVCFILLRDGFGLITMGKTPHTRAWMRAVGAILVLLGLSAILAMGLQRLP